MPQSTALAPGAAPSGAGPIVQRWIEQVRAARADGSALCIRGGGTKDFLGAGATGTALHTAELHGISSYEPSEMVITARAGTPLAQVEAALAEGGQCLAFEPPHLGPGATLGGMVAAGLAGPARMRAGGVRDFVLGASLLNGRAELLRFGGQVMKNVAGYDIARALVGSMGILGVICEVSLKVPPVARARATLRLECGQGEAVLRVARWQGEALPVAAAAWHANELRVRLEGAAAAVDAGAQRLYVAGAAATDTAEAAAYWNDLREQRLEFFARAAASCERGARLWRLFVDPTHPPLDLAGETLLEWGGGLRWLASDTPPESVQAAAARAGGHAAVFRGARVDGEHLPQPSQPIVRIHRALKDAFDPDRVFNRGRLYGWL